VNSKRNTLSARFEPLGFRGERIEQNALSKQYMALSLCSLKFDWYVEKDEAVVDDELK
jgi:hypothetical protein